MIVSSALAVARCDRKPSGDYDYDFKSGVVISSSTEKSEGGGGCECGEAQCLTVKIQFDRYDYRLREWPSNCHTIAECIIEHEVTEEDVKAALESIKSVMNR